jgi:hypothetical protein
MYSPSLGRSLQTDPVGYQDDLNWYAYVGNNPIDFTDPTGMISASGFGSASSAPAASVSAPVQAFASAPKLDAPTFSVLTAAVGDKAAIQVAASTQTPAPELSDWLSIDIPTTVLRELYQVDGSWTVALQLWLIDICSALADLADHVHSHAPLVSAVIGEEVSGSWRHPTDSRRVRANAHATA